MAEKSFLCPLAIAVLAAKALFWRRAQVSPYAPLTLVDLRSSLVRDKPKRKSVILSSPVIALITLRKALPSLLSLAIRLRISLESTARALDLTPIINSVATLAVEEL